MLSALARSTRRHPIPWVIAALIAPVAIFYLPLLLGTHTFPDGDFTHHFLPFSLFRSEAIRAFHLPIWNPATYSGHPFLADTQAAVFYPVSALLEAVTLFWTEASARLYWLQVEAALETMLAGGFTFLLARALGVDRWAAILAGTVFALSGYLTAYPPLQLAVLRTAIWLPCLLWLLLRMAQTPRAWRYPLALAITTAVTISAGHPQTWLHIGYAAGVWALFLGWAALRAQDWRYALRFLVVAVAATLVGALLAAAQLLPSFEFLQLSVRAAVDYDFVSGGFPVQDSWQLLLPGVLTLWSPLYVGVPALLLALVAVISPMPQPSGSSLALPSWRGTVGFFAILALVALLISFGNHGFLYPLVYHLPGWSLFRGQERVALLVAFSLSVLAGMGAHRFAGLTAEVRRGLGIAALALVALTTLIFLFGWQLAGQSAVGETRFLQIALPVALAALLLVALGWRPGWSFVRSLGMVALAAASLFVANYGINLEPVTPAQRTTVAPELIALQDAVLHDASQGAGRVYNEYRVYEDYAMRLGVEDLWGSSPLRLERYARFNDNFPLDRWWTLTGVEHLLTWRKELFVPSTLLAEYPQATDTTWLHRLTEPHPRAWFVPSVTVADDEEALALLADHAFDLSASVVLPPESGAVASASVSSTSVISASVTSASVTRLSPESLQLVFTAPSDGLLYVAENWMPGWQVSNYGIGAADSAPIQGMPAFVPQRANLSFLAIPVPAGTHELTLIYAPQSVTTGLRISAATLLLLFALGLWRLFFPPVEPPQ